jgi:hypothetical protein
MGSQMDTQSTDSSVPAHDLNGETVVNTAANTRVDSVTSRRKAIQKNLAVFLERTEYTLGSEPVTLDKSVEDTILADIFSRSIPVNKQKAIEIARLSAAIGHVSIFPRTSLHEFSSRISLQRAYRLHHWDIQVQIAMFTLYVFVKCRLSRSADLHFKFGHLG